MLDETSLRTAVVEVFEEIYGGRLVSVLVFGSRARGGARADSDLDLFVVVEGIPHERWRRYRTLDGIEERLAARLGVAPIDLPRLDIVLKPRDRAGRSSFLYLDLARDAVPLLDRDGFMGGVLDRLRRDLARRGAQCRRVDDGWYWVLDPKAPPLAEIVFE